MAGIVAGSLVNIGIITIGILAVPVPGCEGMNMFTPEFMECMITAMPNFTAINFIGPFLGHALGTLMGAYVAAKIAASHAKWLALLIGAWFLYGGISAVMQFGGPGWFKVLDLVVAYIPMAFLGWKLAKPKTAVDIPCQN